jgi:hypothetical protein
MQQPHSPAFDTTLASLSPLKQHSISQLLLSNQVMDHAKSTTTAPEIFRLNNVTPKFHFYRDQAGGERMLPREMPKVFAYQVQNGYMPNGHPHKSRSITKMDERVSLLPPNATPAKEAT